MEKNYLKVSTVSTVKRTDILLFLFTDIRGGMIGMVTRLGYDGDERADDHNDGNINDIYDINNHNYTNDYNDNENIDDNNDGTCKNSFYRFQE